MYQEAEKLAERTAFNATLTNFVVRVLVALSFVAIVLALPSAYARIAALIWAARFWPPSATIGGGARRRSVVGSRQASRGRIFGHCRKPDHRFVDQSLHPLKVADVVWVFNKIFRREASGRTP